MNQKTMKKNGKFAWVFFVFVASVLLLSSCVTFQPKPGEAFACNKGGTVNKTIAPQASLEEFSCMIKKWKGADTLHFAVTLKNISNEEQRYKVNIFLENGKAVGGLIPRKTKGGLVKPGDTASFEYPVKGVAGAPGNVDLIIKTMSK